MKSLFLAGDIQNINILGIWTPTVFVSSFACKSIKIRKPSAKSVLKSLSFRY